MLTSQQKEMLEKLPNLLSKYGGINNSHTGYGTECSKYFEYLREKYMGSKKDSRTVFTKMTNVQKDAYYELCGNVHKLKTTREKTLAQVACGLRLTYEEAFMLFYYNGKNLLCDNPFYQAMNNELLKLDTVDWTKLNEEGSMVLFSKMMEPFEGQ